LKQLKKSVLICNLLDVEAMNEIKDQALDYIQETEEGVGSLESAIETLCQQSQAAAEAAEEWARELTLANAIIALQETTLGAARGAGEAKQSLLVNTLAELADERATSHALRAAKASHTFIYVGMVYLAPFLTPILKLSLP
jgi:hypothetical protein